MFKHLNAVAGDPLIALIMAYKQDPNPKKIDLGVGVYKDDNGHTPVLNTVKKAEAILLEQQGSKSYLGIYGAAEFEGVIQNLLLGENNDITTSGRIRSTQTPGGTGALRIAADFIHASFADARLWVSDPTWGNHTSIFEYVGVEVKEYPYYDRATSGLRFDDMMATLKAETKPGDVLLLHACCHNPTGVDLEFDHWKELTELVNERGLLPLVDAAYQGFGDGLNKDLEGFRYMADNVSDMLIANSFSKNFGIYRDRCGGLSVIGETAEDANTAFSIIGQAIRANYSMPPAHGAEVVYTIMSDPALAAEWELEVAAMRDRINNLREKLVTKLAASGVSRDFGFIKKQRGMFSYSGLTPEQVHTLRYEYAIYMADTGRISIAGVSDTNIDYLCESIAKVVG
ncbi:aromatic amino acid transaminase [Marinomonas algarum]|uniref:Aspartate/tyrosine/aromatic aminotransferase n=1 Tax=Marinomonas algarum TaxID=2883105 RepID=A0A9X1IP30_9GAMM|nr:amino acid aminotransferase [Marinomonas algarum]MCB5162877.1 aspartate/tyrosine/aromatic aminotransferase [Marinomonas algarum]